MNAYDARIVRLFTAQVDGTVEDDTPNARARVPFQFDLILQAEVGAVLGDTGANYILTFSAINDDMVARQVSLNPVGNPFREEWSAAYGWVQSGNDFVKTGKGEADGIMRYRIDIPSGLTGVFHYNVRMVSDNFQVVSFARSNPFLLVEAPG
jgi:hypothetical protein